MKVEFIGGKVVHSDKVYVQCAAVNGMCEGGYAT